jgi:hypothetical protein
MKEINAGESKRGETSKIPYGEFKRGNTPL